MGKSWAGAGGPPEDPLLSAQPYIQVLQNSKDPRIRARAAIKLGSKIRRRRIGEEDFALIPDIRDALIKALKKDNNPKVRSSAAFAFHEINGLSQDKKVFAALIDSIKNDKDAEVRFSAASSLWSLDFQFSSLNEIKTEVELITPVLKEALKGAKDPEVRGLAANALGKIGSEKEFQTKKVIPVLIEALNKETEPEVRFLVANALGKIDSEPKMVVPALAKALKKERIVQVRLSIIDALEKFGPKADAAVPVLTAILQNDTDKYVRFKAAYVLGMIKQEVQTVVPELIKILKNSSDKLERKQAIEVLTRIDYKPELTVQALIEALNNDKDNEVRSCAGFALSYFNSQAETVIAVLIKRLKEDKYSIVRANAAYALKGNNLLPHDVSSEICTLIGDYTYTGWNNDEITAIPKSFQVQGKKITSALIYTLQNDKDPRVRSASLFTLKNYTSEKKVIVPALIQTLKNDINSEVRTKAAYVLDNFSSEAKLVIPALLEALKKDPEENVRSAAASSFATISEQWQDNLNKLSDKELENAILGLERALNIVEGPTITKIITGEDRLHIQGKIKLKRTLNALKAKQASRIAQSEMFAKWMREHIWIPGLLIIPGVYFALLRFYPYYLLFLPSSFTIPKVGKISSKIILRIKYRPRALDAWVNRYLGSTTLNETEQPRAKIRFWELDPASSHVTYIPIAIRLQANGKNARYENIPLWNFQEIFRENTARLLIHGEGGVGKTSLACQLAQLAMVGNHHQRLCKQHPMIPVLIEPELIEQEIIDRNPFPIETIRKGDDIIKRSWDNTIDKPLVEAIRKQIQFLINEQEPITDELLQQLLQSGRILVIIDRFSEMSKQARQAVVPASKTYPINALVIISRQQEKLDNVKLDIAEPLQLTGSELMRFMEEYLKQTKAIEIKQQPPLYQACENLQRIVEAQGSRSMVTVLIAKLAAEQIIARKPLPTSIPNLVLQSLDLLNAQIKRREFKLDNQTIHRDAQAIAWTCLQSTYRPNTAPLRLVEQALNQLHPNEDISGHLKYLEKELRIIETVGNNQNQVRIVLDPLAEYLAGLHLIKIYGSNESAWKEFFKRANEFEKEAIMGFLLAVKDCCRVASLEQKVPAFVINMFNQYTQGKRI